MHQNYFFLRKLCNELKIKVEGLELATCFSQNRDELVLGFCSPSEEFWMKAVLHAQVNALCFPHDFQRAKQNTVELFKPAIGKKVVQVRQFLNERAFGFALEENIWLVFKLFGNKSNVLLFEGEEAIAIFRNQQAQDGDLRLGELDRPFQLTPELLQEKGLKAIPTIGKEGMAWLQAHGWENADAQARWNLAQKLLQYLENPDCYLTETPEGLPKLSLFQTEGAVLQPNAMEASNAFFYQFSKIFYLNQQRQEVLRQLQKKAKSTWNYIEKTAGKLHELKHSSRYEEMGHLLMANLHLISPRAEKIAVQDLYKNDTIEIKLNPVLSPQKNAENYYRKAKNQKIEIAQLEDNLRKKEEIVLALEEQILQLEGVESLKELRKYLKVNDINPEETQQAVFPFKRFAYNGFDIWVGKNAKNNDLLTQKYAFKEDLWLHARDVSGSHVIIKYQAGKAFPADVIEKAASLAAYYSQRKNDSLCPVICTPKKYVRKPKGLDAGAVIVDKEDVLMVVPAAFE